MRVVLKSHIGKTIDIPSSVPQGSVLGPILFAIFLGSLKLSDEQIEKGFNVIKYADDIIAIDKLTCINVNPTTHESSKSIVLDWALAHDLPMNSDKLKQLFVRKSNSLHYDENFDGIPAVDSIRYLGVVFDNKMDFSSHVEHCLAKASQRLYILRVVKQVLDKKRLSCICKSLVDSIFLFAAPLLVSLKAKDKNEIKNFDKRCHRIVCCNNPSQCSNYTSIIQLLTDSCKTLYLKAISNADHPLYSLCPQRLSQTGMLRQMYCHTVRRQRSFIPQLTLLLNEQKQTASYI